MKLIADKPSTEANYQFNMAIRLLQMNLDVDIEVVPKDHRDCRFDVCIMDGRNIRGIIEMKRHLSGDMKQIESEWWKSDQGKRYAKISNQYNIPVLFCAGPSEIERVTKQMKKLMLPWYLRWLI